MTTTFNWIVSAMDCIPQTPEGADYVVVVHWACNGTDGTYNASVYSTCSLPVVESANFVPYASLTQDQVLGWIWANGVDKASAEAAVQSNIDLQINPVTIQPPLPWSNT